MKTCTVCGETKPLSAFYRDAAHPDGHKARCKICYRADSRHYCNNATPERKKKRKAKQREYNRKPGRHIKNRYGISLAQYDEMLEAQEYGCAICGTTPEENGQRLAVDHDHETGKVRGLLCGGCNRGIGLFQDRIELLQSAIGYLSEITD